MVIKWLLIDTTEKQKYLKMKFNLVYLAKMMVDCTIVAAQVYSAQFEWAVERNLPSVEHTRIWTTRHSPICFHNFQSYIWWSFFAVRWLCIRLARVLVRILLAVGSNEITDERPHVYWI